MSYNPSGVRGDGKKFPMAEQSDPVPRHCERSAAIFLRNKFPRLIDWRSIAASEKNAPFEKKFSLAKNFESRVFGGILYIIPISALNFKNGLLTLLTALMQIADF